MPTLIVWPLGAESVTVKFALTEPELPSVTVTSLTVRVGGVSSSMIAPPPWSSARVAFVGSVRLRTYVSLASSSRSPLTSTVSCCVVWPGVKVSEPLRAW